MVDRKQIFRLQELFIAVAETKLPSDPQVSWNDYQVMTYYWPSPCDRVEGLWVNVNEHEIMLATRLSHTHVDADSWEVRNSQAGNVLDRIVDQGIVEALDILNSETVFVKLYDNEGNEDTSSGMSPRWNWNDPEQRAGWTKFRGEGWTARAWDWNGEVKAR